MTDAPTAKTKTARAPKPDAGRDYKETLFLPQTAFPMRAGLPKAEPAWLERWARIKLHARVRAQSKGRRAFVLHDGPPYANGHLHMGHALNKILKDVIVRSRQMEGYDSVYVPGWDCHGLPIEWKVEAAFRAKGRKKDDVPAAEFRAACRAYAEEWVEIQSAEFQRLGVTGHWEAPYLTMSYDAEAAIVRQFLTFAETGQVYRGSKPVMWSPVERTALAEAEIEYHDHQSTTIWVKFPVVGKPGRWLKADPEEPSVAGASVVIWTTTPWTIPGNRAIAYGDSVRYGLYEVQTVEKVVDPKTGEEKDPWSKPGDRLVVALSRAEDVRESAKITEWSFVGEVWPSQRWKCAHPLRGHPDAGGYFDFDVPLLSGDHVTDEAGTGFVHTAPSHGQEDFDVWMAHGLGQENIPDMVDERGAYIAEGPHAVPLFAGEQVIRTEGKKAGQDGGANAAVIKALIAANALLARGRITHPYPHSWRSKAPVIFRNTPQWFIRLDQPVQLPGETKAQAKSLRARALKAIDEVEWAPSQSVNRIRSMVEGRPDWLISRQRAWGVPIALFVDKTTGAPLVDEKVNARIVRAFETGGADAWFAKPKSAFLKGRLPEGKTARDYEKVSDILDVWFDSGSTHAFALEDRGLPWPADVYLEGSDQHRGWFQSSLLVGCGTRGTAPYKSVITHGFLLAEDGQKMSKSLGNSVDPAEASQQYGAEILRLWAATSDTTEDMRVGQNILKANVDAYRKLRNTIRYLLGALDGFSEDERIAPEEMPALERWVLHRLLGVEAAVRAGFERYNGRAAFNTLFQFCTNDLSAFYLDVRKDALYCDRPDSARRRACRTVMDLIFERLTAWLAPVMCFTMEEAWLARFPSEDGSVHLRTFPDSPSSWRDDVRAERWERIRRVRRVVTGALEIERRDKRIGSSLEAAPTVWLADADDHAALAHAAHDSGLEVEPFLAEICITSQAVLKDGTGPTTAFRLEDAPGVAVEPGLAQGRKCARSWRITSDVGSDPRYPDLSARDAEAVALWDAAHGR